MARSPPSVDSAARGQVQGWAGVRCMQAAASWPMPSGRPGLEATLPGNALRSASLHIHLLGLHGHRLKCQGPEVRHGALGTMQVLRVGAPGLAASHQSCPPLPFVPQATVPWQEVPHSALGLGRTTLRPGRWGSFLRTGVPPAQGGQGWKETAHMGWEMGSGWILDALRGQCASTFGRYCFVFNYTKSPDFILSYQRHRMPACSDQKKTQVGSQREKFQWTWASTAASSESFCRLPVHQPHL